MGNHSIDRVKEKQNDIKRNIEQKKDELNQLEQRKQSLLDSGTNIQNSDMDDETIKVVMELINQELEENSEMGKELSNEMQNDLSFLTEMKYEVNEMKESTEKNLNNLEQKKSILDKFKRANNIDSAISEMEDSKVQLDELNNNLIDTEKDLTETSQRLGML